MPLTLYLLQILHVCWLLITMVMRDPVEVSRRCLVGGSDRLRIGIFGEKQGCSSHYEVYDNVRLML